MGIDPSCPATLSRAPLSVFSAALCSVSQGCTSADVHLCAPAFLQNHTSNTLPLLLDAKATQHLTSYCWLAGCRYVKFQKVCSRMDEPTLCDDPRTWASLSSAPSTSVPSVHHHIDRPTCGMPSQVTHLTIFIEDNQGDEDVTRVQRIQLLGVAQDTFDVAKIKKVEEG